MKLIAGVLAALVLSGCTGPTVAEIIPTTTHPEYNACPQRTRSHEAAKAVAFQVWVEEDGRDTPRLREAWGDRDRAKGAMERACP